MLHLIGNLCVCVTVSVEAVVPVTGVYLEVNLSLFVYVCVCERVYVHVNHLRLKFSTKQLHRLDSMLQLLILHTFLHAPVSQALLCQKQKNTLVECPMHLFCSFNFVTEIAL